MIGPNIVPLGQLKVTSAGTPISMALNCGSLGGGVGTIAAPALAGTALRQVVLTAPAANTLLVYILPRGKTKTNTDAIIAAINPGQTISLPQGVMTAAGFLPENFVVDADTSNNMVYGCGFLG